MIPAQLAKKFAAAVAISVATDARSREQNVE
ncbi:hypothetical protein J2S31_001055 [Nitrospina gracilis Nb-211]|nr:hypothetical protein [Nitrospina gracilis Nb-211]